jgi:hypothetical protein
MLRYLGGGAEFTGGRNGSCRWDEYGGTNFYAWSNDCTSGNADIAHGNTAIGYDAWNNESAERNSVNSGYGANYSGHYDPKHYDTRYDQHNDSEQHYPEHHYPEFDNAKHSHTRSAGQFQSRRNVFHNPG